MTKRFFFSLFLLFTIVVPLCMDSLAVASGDAIYDHGDQLLEADDFDEFWAGFSQRLDKFLDSAAFSGTFAISIWNH